MYLCVSIRTSASDCVYLRERVFVRVVLRERVCLCVRVLVQGLCICARACVLVHGRVCLCMRVCFWEGVYVCACVRAKRVYLCVRVCSCKASVFVRGRVRLCGRASVRARVCSPQALISMWREGRQWISAPLQLMDGLSAGPIPAWRGCP